MTPEQRRAALERVEFQYLKKGESKGPWALPVNGETWAIVTDGHILVAVKAGSVSGALADCPAIVARVAGHCFAETPFLQVFTRADVSAFAGFSSRDRCADCNGDGKVECDKCDGAGELHCHCYECGDDHERQCGRCLGRGSVKCRTCGGINERSYATLLGVAIDRMKLADLLMAAASDSASDINVAVSQYGTNGHIKADVFIFRGVDDDFRGLIMPLLDVKTPVAFEQPETWRKELATAQATEPR